MLIDTTNAVFCFKTIFCCRKKQELKVNIVDLEKAFLVPLKKTETEEVNVISDNKSLARRIKTMSSETWDEGVELNLENENAD